MNLDAEVMTKEPTTAWVGNTHGTRIVAKQLPNGAWEPLYGVRSGTPGQRELPACFALNKECTDALDAAARTLQ